MKIVEENQNILVIKDYGFFNFTRGVWYVIVAGIIIFSLPYLLTLLQETSSLMRILAVGALGMIVILAVPGLLQARFRKTTFNKSQDSVVVKSLGLLSAQRINEKISDIARVIMFSQHSPQFNMEYYPPSVITGYRIALVKHDGSNIFIDALHRLNIDDEKVYDTKLNDWSQISYYPKQIVSLVKRFGLGGLTYERNIGQKIASFIGVPFQELDLGVGDITNIRPEMVGA